MLPPEDVFVSPFKSPYATMALLRAEVPVSGAFRETLSFAVLGDGGGGRWRAVSGLPPGTYTHDGGSVVVPIGGDGSRAWLNDDGPIMSVKRFGAKGDGTTADQTVIQRAIAAAILAGGGTVDFPGDESTRYAISAQLTVTGANVRLRAMGGARLKLLSTLSVPIAVGNIDTGLVTGQSNTLLSNAAAGTSAVTLASGKGANITANTWLVIRSTDVVPDHDAAVVNTRAEFVQVYSVAGDVVTFSRPLRMTYNTAATAQVYNVNWIRGFEIDGLGFDGNNKVDCSTGVLMNWCLFPKVRSSAVALQQRFVRFQGCLGGVANVQQSDGLSDGFQGDTGHFSYTVIEGGLNEGLVVNSVADRTRHAYSTGAGWVNNSGATSGVITGVGVPMASLVSGTASNMRGSGWDTHEVGFDIVFNKCKTLGALHHGFQNRCVRTVFNQCEAYDTIGAAIQLGSDSRDTKLNGFVFARTNLGTDTATVTNWTKQSEIVDNSPRSFIGTQDSNYIENGNLDVWDKGTPFAATGGTANRWKLVLGTGAVVSVSRGTHTVGSGSGVASGRYYLGFNRGTTGSTASSLQQYVEDVRVFSGQRIAVSFDCRTSVALTELSVFIRQNFGTGGAPSSDVDSAVVVRALDDNWKRVTCFFDVPSITGKTIGSNEDSASILVFEWPTAAGATFFHIDRVKIEIASMVTSFVPETLAAASERCRRWYEKSYADATVPGTTTETGCVRLASPTANSNYYRCHVPYSTRKARAPTVNFYSTSGGAIANVRNITAGTDIGAATSNSGVSGFYGGVSTITGVAAADVCGFHWTAVVPDFE